MIQEYVDRLIAPFRNAYFKVLGITAKKDEFAGDVQRIKQMKDRAKDNVANAKQKAQDIKGKAQAAKQQAQAAHQKVHAVAGQAQGHIAANKKKAKKKMSLFGKKNVCANCGQP